MRVFTRILKISFIVILVLGVILNIILAVPSTTFSLFTNKKKAYKELYNSSIIALSESNSITVNSSMPYEEKEGFVLKEEITCKTTTKDDKEDTKCTMISKIYNEKLDLVSTSYVPGDGFKYTAENNTYTKTKYQDSETHTYLLSLLIEANLNLEYLIMDSASAEHCSLKDKKGLLFDLNSFSVNKKVSITYKESEDTKNTIKYRFDSKDRLEYIASTTDVTTLSIQYKHKKLKMPDFIGYTEKK